MVYLSAFTVGGCIGWAIDSWRVKRKKIPNEVGKESSYGTSYETQTAVLKSTDHSTTPQMRIGFIDALNGRILEVSTQVPHPGVSNHYDWKTEMYVVPEDQKLSEAIAVVMLMKGLEK
jgi:hypothetical protein